MVKKIFRCFQEKEKALKNETLKNEILELVKEISKKDIIGKTMFISKTEKKEINKNPTNLFL